MSKYIKTNLTIHILIAIDFHQFGYEDVFNNLYSHLGVNIIEWLLPKTKLINVRRQNDRDYKKNNVKILGEKLIFKNRDKKTNQSKDEIKGFFYGSGYSTGTIFEVEHEYEIYPKIMWLGWKQVVFTK